MKTGTCSACLGEAMDVLFRDQQQWRLRIQSIDDLWVLQRLLRPGFSMAMLGERRDQTTGGDEGGRSKQAERKKMWIQLLVVKAEHQAFADALRVHGTIEEAPVDVGLHHTHVVNLRDEILISSSQRVQQRRQRTAGGKHPHGPATSGGLVGGRRRRNDSVFCDGPWLERKCYVDDARRRETGDLRQTDSIAAQFRSTVVDGLTQQLDDEMPMVLCGPGKNRDRMLNDLKQAGHQRTMMSVGTSMGGRGAANEVLRDGLAGALLSEHRMVKEIGLLEEAWQRISNRGAVAYGRAEVAKAVQEGAVDTLLIVADLLRDTTTSCDGTPWDDVVALVEQFSGTVVQCSTDHDDGEQLLGFGGVVALLRYAM